MVVLREQERYYGIRWCLRLIKARFSPPGSSAFKRRACIGQTRERFAAAHQHTFVSLLNGYLGASSKMKRTKQQASFTYDVSKSLEILRTKRKSIRKMIKNLKSVLSSWATVRKSTGSSGESAGS